MKATIKGLILEKLQKQKGNEQRLYLRMYQHGEKDNLDIRVSQKTYQEAKQGEILELKDVTVGAYVFHDKVGIFAKEEV